MPRNELTKNLNEYLGFCYEVGDTGFFAILTNSELNEKLNTN